MHGQIRVENRADSKDNRGMNYVHVLGKIIIKHAKVTDPRGDLGDLEVGGGGSCESGPLPLLCP